VSDTKREAPKDVSTPAEYIRANFDSSDRIAILVRNAKRGETTQRISTTAKVTDTPFQDWMRYKNDRDGCDIYVGMNALKATAFTRTKHDVLAIRHLYADLDHDGSASLAAIEKSSFVPAPDVKTSESAQPVPLSRLACEVLREWRKEQGSQGPYIFPSPRDASKPIRSVKRAWRTALAKADVPYFPIYSLRHGILYATQLGSTGCDCPARNAPQ
jgi:hypothetical protein